MLALKRTMRLKRLALEGMVGVPASGGDLVTPSNNLLHLQKHQVHVVYVRTSVKVIEYVHRACQANNQQPTTTGYNNTSEL